MAPLLEVRDVVKEFGGLRALSEVCLSVEQGQILGLIGPNGAGKSTLVDIIAGRTRSTTGKVLFDGEDVSDMHAHRRASLGMTRTFQATRTFPLQTGVQATMTGFALSAKDSFVSWLLRPWFAVKERRRVVDAATHSLGSLDLHSALTSEPVGMLAPGVNRMLGFALATASSPRLLVLDEPGAGLSPKEKAILAARIRATAEDGVGVLLIEHDVPFIMSTCHRVVAMDHGLVIADGYPDEVRNDPKVQTAYLGGMDVGS